MTGKERVIAVSAETMPRTASEEGELTAPLMAMRTELGMVAALLAAAGLAWWWTVDRMAGMDAGPGTDLGTLGWFTGVWAVMMAAMMLPSLAPTAAVFAALVRRKPSWVLLFAGGYLLVWSAAGVVAYGLFELGKSLFANALAWHGGGRLLAAGVLVAAALYQLTPYKRAFLRGAEAHCDSCARGGARAEWGPSQWACAAADGAWDARGR